MKGENVETSFFCNDLYINEIAFWVEMIILKIVRSILYSLLDKFQQCSLIACIFSSAAGQFWNIPIKVTPFNFHGQATYDLQMQDLYQIEVSNTNSFPRRFVAELYDLTWDPTRKDHCLYAGDQQGGRILEISNPNDPVIQGVYTFYRTQGLFDSHFQYTQFNESICS